jgi:acetyl esterase/lipase
MAYAYDSEITAWPSMLPSGPFTDVSVEQFDATAARIASEAGAVMVSVEYRLAPEHPFPAELEDCYAARVWTAKSRDTTDVSPYAAPVRAENLAGLPPAFISAGRYDPFRDEDIDYVQRLPHADVPTELALYSGALHGFPTPESALGRRVLTKMPAALHRGLDV